MANWVSGYLKPFGSDKQLKELIEYVETSKQWRWMIDNQVYREVNTIPLFSNSAYEAISLAYDLEEKFRHTDFRFFVYDNTHNIGWGIEFTKSIETEYNYVEDPNEPEALRPEKIGENIITDKYIKERKERLPKKVARSDKVETV